MFVSIVSFYSVFERVLQEQNKLKTLEYRVILTALDEQSNVGEVGEVVNSTKQKR